MEINEATQAACLWNQFNTISVCDTHEMDEFINKVRKIDVELANLMEQQFQQWMKDKTH